ncbi:MAG: transposase [Patescibacteria group bacterium]|nr:transposase [Patescibacteria group bacterium]
MTQRRIYQDEYPYFVTFRTNEGSTLFEETKYAILLSHIIFKAGRIKHYHIISYQIMPDHVHLLVYNKPQAQASVPARTSKTSARTSNIHRATTDLPAVLWQAGSCTRGMVKTNGAHLSAGARGRQYYRDYNISQLLYTIKSHFINELRKKHDIPYTIWQRRFYTRIINNDEYFKAVLNYIKRNPIKGLLPRKYHKSPYQYFNWDIISKTLK